MATSAMGSRRQKSSTTSILFLLVALVALARADDPVVASLRRLRGPGAAGWIPRGQERTTWNGCTCLDTWSTSEGTCTGSCCDAYGTGDLVCKTQDPHCEREAFGYCRPADYQAATCEDQPNGWHDINGWSCAEYRSHHWCTTDGHYGPHWHQGWGNFEDYMWSGKSAWDACCACGGGQTTEAQCTDAPNWRDSDGSGCSTYAQGHWCTPAGSTGFGWRDSWGSLTDYGVNGVSASDACCACGGDEEKAREATTTSTEPEPEPRQPELPTEVSGPRFATNGCPCAQTWSWYRNGPRIECQSGCCAVSNDAYPQLESLGEVCIPSGHQACFSQEPLQCEPAGFCSDLPDWRDLSGSTCNDYIDGSMCTNDGHAGPSWMPNWGDIGSWANPETGKSALEACCGCGGGRRGNHSSTTSVAPSTTVAGSPACSDLANWTDSENDSCHDYESSHWCTSEGLYGPAWDPSWGNFDDYIVNHSLPAYKACCACGGGSATNFEGPGVEPTTTTTEAPTTTTTQAPPTTTTQAPQCSDVTGWSDTDGDTCESYTRFQYCNTSGGYGAGWDSNWGTFADYSHHGMSALEACCGCGGGSDPSGALGFLSAPNTTTVAAQCIDTPGWLDTDGDDCLVYQTASWCTSSGEYGTGWHSEWGTFDDYALADSPSALGACCACGGGTMGSPGADPTRNSDTTATTTMVPSEQCTDTAGWTDNGGDTCLDYQTDGYCNSSGYGPHWYSAWGSFEDWAMPGRPSAAVACCACGGGSTGTVGTTATPPTAAPTTTTAQCTDVTDWVDKENYPCSTYVSEEWCTPSGTAGTGWKNWWGTVADWAPRGGVSAFEACCGCGGGHSEGLPTTTTTTAEPADLSQCHSLDNWADKDGYGCSTYVDSLWCTADGYGSNWKAAWGSFDQNAATGSVGAQYACCGCGGGYFQGAPVTTTTTPSDCLDLADWEDKDGDTCQIYVRGHWCKPDGGVGLGWQSAWGSFNNYTKPGSVPATVACCGCGGGSSRGDDSDEGDDDSDGNLTTTTLATTVPPSAATTNPPASTGDSVGDSSSACVNFANFTDSDGDACADYANYHFCTSDGGYGAGWVASWGHFDDYRVDGISAADACCACGGGTRNTEGARRLLAESLLV